MATSYRLLLEKPMTSHTKTICLIVLTLAAIISSTTLIVMHLQKPVSSNPRIVPPICNHAQDQPLCASMVAQLAHDGIVQRKDVDLLEIFLQRSILHIEIAIEKAKNVKRWINSRDGEAALVDCLELMDLSVDRVIDSVLALKDRGFNGSNSNAHTWLSTVLTNHVTCLDGLKDSGSISKLLLASMETVLTDLILRAKTSLAMVVAVLPLNDQLTRPLNGEFPPWVDRSDRRLLQARLNEINANVVVAKDGSGNYKTVKEAVASAPDKGKTRYVIYVKKGIYKENVEVGKKKTNVMLTGDGMDKTIITGNLNVIDGSTTFNSATVAAVGDGFIAQDIWFQNTAGPQKHQAVALRVGADESVINRCRMDAYQDTLYTHTNRQFYRDSYITGTVDFIFGNAAVVFQNCKLVARKPMSGQKNMVTAQGRLDPNQNTGTSIQACDVIASSDLEPVKTTITSYLGRPWKEYSRTVVMQSKIGDHIDPEGWSVWSGDFALKTLYYGEYKNKGPGAGTSKRVKWEGYHVIKSAADAKKFTVAELIQGGSWLQSTGVTFTEGL